MVYFVAQSYAMIQLWVTEYCFNLLLLTIPIKLFIKISAFLTWDYIMRSTGK